MRRNFIPVGSAMLVLLSLIGLKPARAQEGLQKVNHIIIVMQENHSFDNYFGALAYAPGSPYHTVARSERNWQSGCREGDHKCVDGLTCALGGSVDLYCFNSNVDDNRLQAFSFHDTRRCVLPDLNHEWLGTHQEANFLHPNDALGHSLNDGFVLVNDMTEQRDNGVETPIDDQTMAFYRQTEIPFYYNLAQNFAISDRYFSSLLGPTFPNRSYSLAATSFGHLTASESFPPPGGYKPITGTIFDLLDANHVTWAEYFQDVPAGASFRPFGPTGVDPHFMPYAAFLAEAAGVGTLPQVSYVDPNFGVAAKTLENDEHPPNRYTARAGVRFASCERRSQRTELERLHHYCHVR